MGAAFHGGPTGDAFDIGDLWEMDFTRWEIHAGDFG